MLSLRLSVRRAGVVTSREAFEDYFESRGQQLSNGKHVLQWRATTETYVFSLIGKRPVAEVTSAEILAIGCKGRRRFDFVGRTPLSTGFPSKQHVLFFLAQYRERCAVGWTGKSIARCTKLNRDVGHGGRVAAHGFRFSFKVSAAEGAKMRDDVAEACLAHKMPEKVRVDCLRTDFLEE